MTATSAEIQEIVDSHWRTSDLAGFALWWNTTSPAILAGTESPKPVWNVIAVTQQAAQEYYDRLADEDPEQLRWEAAEALASGGLNLRAINRRKS
jgi:hypothetical protein